MDGGRDFGLPERPRVGEHIEGLEVTALLAGGGMGEVYLARRRRAGGFEKRLALKVMIHTSRWMVPSSRCSSTKRASRRRFVYPNVVEVLDTGVHRELPWIAMDSSRGRRSLGSSRRALRPRCSRGCSPALQRVCTRHTRRGTSRGEPSRLCTAT